MTSKNGKNSGKIMSVLLPVLLASITTIILCSSAPIEKIRTWFELEFPTSQAIALSNYNRAKEPIRYFIGPQAVASCLNTCAAYKAQRQAACKRFCHKSSLTEYARRIRKKELSLENEVNKVNSSCQLFADKQKFAADTMPLELILKAYNSFRREQTGNSFAKLKDYFYNNQNLITDFLKHTTKDDTTTESNDQKTLNNQILTDLCWQNYYNLFVLSKILAKQNEDIFSFNFYSAMSYALQKKLKTQQEGTISKIKETFINQAPTGKITTTVTSESVEEAAATEENHKPTDPKFIKYINNEWVMADINSRDMLSTIDTCYVQSEKHFCSLNDKNLHNSKIQEIEDELYFERE
ncbi:MAG: hypothetical protein KBC84_00955 [Proteobacteria bacterium]|nr:hypothetical protein [Pseudomonadota bacterium]